jgi:predicted RNA binding protein YcfA (HicA-like mRNA interferase family)
MKRTELVRIITQNGAEFIRHGANHDWYTNYRKGVSQPIPRHADIPEHTAQKIIKRLK